MQTKGHKFRIINLFCPSLSTIAPFVASDEQRLDIGSIARSFGLEPSTVKLNGHFVSRGADLVSSVTWKSLLSFFSAKRLPTGNSDDDALVVDGKLCKVGVKRALGPQEIVNGDCCQADEEDKKNLNLVKKKKLKYRDLVIGYKRKECTEEVVLLKKLKLNETKSVLDELSDAVGGISDAASVVRHTTYSCSCNSRYMKRMREHETLVSAFCKKTK